MSRFLQIRDQYSRIFGRRFLNSQLSLYIGLLQLAVCVWALLQHVYSIVNFNKILFCDFNANSSLPMAFAGVDAIIFDIGLFHSLWGIDGCVAEHLDGGYGRFGWCVTHIMVLVMCLPCAFLNRPRPFLLWPLLIQQSIYGIGLLILSLAALPRILPTFMGDLNNAPMTAIFAYVIGMFMNFFLLYVYWHWYWHVEAEWDSSRKLRDDEVTPTITRTQQSQRKQPILTQPGGENGALLENGGLKRSEKVVKVDDEGHAPNLCSNFSNGQVNGHMGNGIGFGGKMGENRQKVSLRRTDHNSATIIRQDPPTRVQELVNGLARGFVTDRGHQDIIHPSFGRQGVETPILIDRKSHLKSESPQGSTASSVYSASALRKPKTSEGKLTLSHYIESPDSSLSLSINSNIPPKFEYESNSTTATPLSNATTSRLRHDRRKFEERKQQDSADLHHGAPNVVAPNSTPNLSRSQNGTKMTSGSPKSDVLPRTLAQSRMRMMRKYQSTENYSPVSHKKSQLSQSAHNSFAEENTYDRVHTPSEGTLNSEVETPTAEVASRKDTVESRVSSDIHRPAIFPGRPLDSSHSSYVSDDFLRESRLAQWTTSSPTVLKINPALAYVQANGKFRQSSLDNNLVRRSGGYGSDPEAPRRSNYGQFNGPSNMLTNSARVGNDFNHHRLQNGYSNPSKGIYSNRQHYSNAQNESYSNPSTSYSNQKIVDYSIPEGPEYRDMDDESYSTPQNGSYSNHLENYGNPGKIYSNLPNGYSSPKMGPNRISDGYSNPQNGYNNPGKSYSNPQSEVYSTPPPPSNGYITPYSPYSRTPVPAPAPSPYRYRKQPLGPKGSLDSRLYNYYQTGL